MSEIKFELRGWHALCAGVAILAFCGFRLYLARQALDEPRLRMIKYQILAEHMQQPVAKLKKALESGDRETAAELTENMVRLEDITFKSISAHGGPDDMVVRIDVLIDGEPPETKPVRYYKLKHSLITGLSYPIESTAVAYWLTGLF